VNCEIHSVGRLQCASMMEEAADTHDSGVSGSSP
jgi:hypothetical protein